MSYIFDRLKQHTQDFQDLLSTNLDPVDEGHDYPWLNDVYTGCNIRRAHLDVVDSTDHRKLYMMHLCLFPATTSKAPVYGFDLIAGPNKITGAFHDFSPIVEKHKLNKEFKRMVEDYSWSKTRTLPQWAEMIFSKHIVTASNIKDHDEIERVLSLSLDTLSLYINTLKEEKIDDTIDSTVLQNIYCHYQKQNPHTPRVMNSLGFDAETVRDFIDNCLFPEIEYS